ncbi:hypothetical protein AQUCO_01300417v1 [Aquilegia coerulea]|uniref:Dihydrodipicolinate reductase N-terminal domain-containing protein n=1 Tax=Aquilegia coerulea TaxID=218851 RepID=A0A2G5E1H8_AQUCA|nr:hypothetical protein AQUCO_01300417v1 [Aquilegia coerulea]
MAALSSPFQLKNYNRTHRCIVRSTITCSMQTSQNNIKVVINGATKEIGKAAIVAITKARGMEVAGAVDSDLVGEDVGKLCNMEEALEIPIINDLTMVLGSISQSKATGVVVDFTEPSTVYDNVKQATAFGMKSVVYVPKISLDTVTALSAFCEKATMVSSGVVWLLQLCPLDLYFSNKQRLRLHSTTIMWRLLNQGQMHR